MSDDKEALRKRCRALADACPAAQQKENDAEITRRFLALPELKTVKTVFCYVSVGKEPATDAIVDMLLETGRTVAVPRCEGDGIMEARIIRSRTELINGLYGIPTPLDTAEMLAPAKIDMAIIPALACDRQGNRLGRGAGYYDRWLAGFSGICVCLCCQAVFMDALPAEAHDIRAGIIITEKNTYRF